MVAMVVMVVVVMLMVVGVIMMLVVVVMMVLVVVFFLIIFHTFTKVLFILSNAVIAQSTKKNPKEKSRKKHLTSTESKSLYYQ